jgi:hypothetical protein
LRQFLNDSTYQTTVQTVRAKVEVTFLPKHYGWRWVVSFLLWLPYPWEKSCGTYQLDPLVGCWMSYRVFWSMWWREIYMTPLSRIKAVIQSIASSFTDWAFITLSKDSKVKAKHYTMKTWGWVVSFMPWLIYPQGKDPQYPLDRRMGVPQSWSGRDMEKKNVYPCRELNVCYPAHIVTTVYWLRYPSCSQKILYRWNYCIINIQNFL